MAQANLRLTVSAIVPSFNRAGIIVETIESLLSQTYPLFEIIVVDDGSTDNTKEVLKSYLGTGKIKYFYQENQGPGTARDLGIAKALGDLVAFCDTDDIWFAEKLEKQIKLFNNTEIALVYSDMEMLDGEHFGERFSKVFGIKNFYRGKVFDKLVLKNFIQNSTVMVRRRVIEDCGGFPKDRNFFSVEDYVCWLKIAKDYGIDFIDEPLVKYRWHENNISHQAKKESYQRLADVYAFLIYKYGPLPIVLWKYFESKIKILLSQWS